MTVKQLTSLKSNERLAGIQKEHHVRKQNGKYLAYILEERSGAHVMLAQRLSDLCNAINDLVEDVPEQKVTVAGLYGPLYNKQKNCGDRTKGWVKYRWKVNAYGLDEAAEAFEKARGGFQNALVVGEKGCYNTVVV